LFDHAPIAPEEEAPLRSLGFAIMDAGGTRAFRQPCGHLRGTVCQVYEARPQTCRLYTCETLRALGRGDIDRAEADRRVRVTNSAVANARAHLAPGETFLQMKARFANDPSPTAEFRLAVVMWNMMMDRYFRRPDQHALSVGQVHGTGVAEPIPASTVSARSCTESTITPADGESPPGSRPSRSTQSSPPG
jgi:hypothetical protein